MVDDDTIHFISRYRKETHRGVSTDDAIEIATTQEGRAALTTAIINCCAFAVLMLSEYRPSAWFGGLLALTMVEVATPWIAASVDADLGITYFGKGGILLPALGLLLLTGLIGGLYPALYLSRFQPAAVLRANKSTAETPGGGRIRTGLVVVQFAIAIGLIVSAAVHG